MFTAKRARCIWYTCPKWGKFEHPVFRWRQQELWWYNEGVKAAKPSKHHCQQHEQNPQGTQNSLPHIIYIYIYYITDITKYFSQNALAKGHTLHFNDDWVKRTPNSSSGPRQSPCMVQFLTDPCYMIHHVLIWSFFGSWYRWPISSKHIQGARSPKAYFPQHPAAKSWHSLEIPNHQTTETFYVPWMNHAQGRRIQ